MGAESKFRKSKKDLITSFPSSSAHEEGQKTQDNKHKTEQLELLNHCACPDCTLQESLKSGKKPGVIELVRLSHGYTVHWLSREG